LSHPLGPAAEGGAGAAPSPNKDGKLTWDLGTIPVGGTRRVSFALSGRQQGTVKMTAVARFDCALGGDQKDFAVVRQPIQTEMLVIPALRLSLVDQNDLIRVGDTVTYTLRVTNQGTGPDRNLAVRVMLPPELQFVDSSGPSKGNAGDKGVAFDPVKELAPGQSLTWNIRAKAMKEGDVRTTGQLDSEYLDSPVSTTEPTRLVK
jgi:uncharacterized repeat protein (TIGR01451 family)